MSSRKSSSQRWQNRQGRDPFVNEAGKRGYRSRAAFKLLEIDRREKLFRRGMVVVDLGAAPGGWSQIAARRVGVGGGRNAGRVLAIDRLAVDPIEGVEIVTADFLDDEFPERLLAMVGERRADLVMSDLAPNISGNRTVDQPRSFALADAALVMARELLRSGGVFLCKIFQGQGQQEFENELMRHFGRVKRLKPRASRPESREIYLLASNFRMV